MPGDKKAAEVPVVSDQSDQLQPKTDAKEVSWRDIKLFDERDGDEGGDWFG